MKKVFLTLIVILIISVGSAKAQTVWGIRAGVIVNDNSHFNADFGLEIGPTAYISLSNKLYLNAAAMYSMRTIHYEEHYLEVPVYLGYRIPIGDTSIYVQAGPYAGFNMGFDENIHFGLALMGGINVSKFKLELGNRSDGETYDTPFLGVSYIF